MSIKDIFNSLKALGGVIYKYYRKLYSLEKNGLKESKEYYDIINNIDKLECIEDGLIDYVDSLGSNNVMILCAYAQMDMMGNNRPGKTIHDPSYIMSNKIKEKDIIDMRISYKSTLKGIKYIVPNDTKVFTDYEPKRNQNFIKVIDNELINSDSKSYNNILLDAKYDYMYINCLKNINKNYQLNDDELVDYKSLMISEIYKYGLKFSNLSKKTLGSDLNSRRFALNVNYIRACLEDFSKQDLEYLGMYFNYKINEFGDKNGLEVFMNIINEYYDKIENEEEYKRNI